jgi:multidrug efflux pump subunit AcrB
MNMGIAGRIASSFIQSKLTPLIVIASLLIGIFAVVITPREEEPQILIPMIDVFVYYPGASSEEVEQRVTRAMGKLLWEIEGVEYLYTMSKPGMSLATVRFYVGEDMEDSIVKLYNKLLSNYDKIPQGVSEPIVKPKSIDDVPILTFTFWSDIYNGYELRRVANEVADELKKDGDVSEINVIGGQRRQVRITLDPLKLKAYSVTPLMIADALDKSNFTSRSGSFPYANKEFIVETAGFLKDLEEVGDLPVNVDNERGVYLRDVASITDGPEEPSDYVFIGFGSASGRYKPGVLEAVTVTIAKKKGTNATHIAERMQEKLGLLKTSTIPAGVEIETTRNYGETAKDKSDELLEHMFIAAVSVTLLIALALGWRESIVVLVAIPVTLALTIFVTYMLGYTLNRVTLFALIFSIGILVDDAIVVVENIYRHFKLSGVSIETAVRAVDEVGNPTILATFTVIAALLPMAFVSGLMGPYMRPIPIGASAAMLISLLIAFIISPWLSYIVLGGVKYSAEGKEKASRVIGTLNRMYENNLRGLLGSGRKRLKTYCFISLLLVAACLLVVFKVVTVKMLPFDNKSELQIIVDMPEGKTLEDTAMLSRAIGDYLETVPEVTDYQLYIGTSAPFNFNGLVRHYFLRRGSNVSDIQVNFVPKDQRSAQSHEIAKRIRPHIKEIGDRHGARIKIAEVPPGPPVLSTLVAEIYGPDLNRQIEIAREVMGVFEQTQDVVDVDWYVEDDQQKIVFEVDKEKASRNGISAQNVAKTVEMLLSGKGVGLLHLEKDKEPVEIFLRAPVSKRAGLENLEEITLQSPDGRQVSLSELVNVREMTEDKTIYGKNLKRVVYVTGDVAGTAESPVYSILSMGDAVSKLRLPEGYELKQYSSVQPESEDIYSLKWDGEWQITYEVFRDLGIAFGAVLVLIYVMIVGWFRSFIIPLVIMAPIPLSLVGILPGHALLGAFFTATSMIGFIAGAGIVVRNSIILVDFIELKLSEGETLKEAVVQAGVIRFRPMLLTASAVVVGSSVILFDPIFQGMAIALMAGEVAATLLSRTMVPLLYYEYKSRAG